MRNFDPYFILPLTVSIVAIAISAAQATGKASVASGCGFGCSVMGALGCAIFSVERSDDNFSILSVSSAIVDGEKIKPDTWYTCIGGKFVEST